MGQAVGGDQQMRLRDGLAWMAVLAILPLARPCLAEAGVVAFEPRDTAGATPLVRIAPQTPACSEGAIVKEEKVYLRGLKASDFEHPWDAAALKALRKAKGLDWVTQKMLELGTERYMAINNVATRVQISDKQFPELYNLLKDAAYILDMPVPRLYLESDPYPNAYTSGNKEPFIVVTSSLIDLMDDSELSFVLGHELGHIKSNHVLYKLLAANIESILGMVGQATLGLGQLIGQGFELVLQDWSRKSELSADRAGLLVVQDEDVAIRVMMKLAGGFSPKVFGKLNKAAFLEQAQEYYDMRGNVLSLAYQVVQTADCSHPWPVLRAAEMEKWFSAKGYQTILKTRGRPLN